MLKSKKVCLCGKTRENIGSHIVFKNGKSTHEEKLQAIVNMLRTRNAKEVQGFMGHYGYY